MHPPRYRRLVSSGTSRPSFATGPAHRASKRTTCPPFHYFEATAETIQQWIPAFYYGLRSLDTAAGYEETGFWQLKRILPSEEQKVHILIFVY
jgi:hypothetical protein